MSGLDIFSMTASIMDALLFVLIVYIFLHDGETNERKLTDKEIMRRGWLIIALGVSLLCGVILLVFALWGVLPL